MATKQVNKVVYGNRTLIDLTSDTVTQDKILNGFTAHDKSGATITGTCDFDVNSTDATVAVAEILDGKTAYARGAKLVGTMPNKGAVNGTITTKAEQFTIPTGFHDGSGKVGIDATEQAKIIEANIKEGVTILGVTGTLAPASGVKAQSKTVTPSISEISVLPDEGYDYLATVTVSAIPTSESDNSAGGITFTIAGA